MLPRLKHDWALIAHDYMDGASIQELCARYGITRANLNRHIREDGWTQPPASPPSSSKSIDTLLAGAMEHSLALLEKRISEMRDSPSSEHEQATKSLIALARTICSLGQLMERREKLAQIAQANAAASRVNDNDDEADTEKLRADLARRLERLVAEWRAKQADETTA
jgi:AcrR family transcriptional regulator